jgi:Flp pilus assembly protein TadG
MDTLRSESKEMRLMRHDDQGAAAVELALLLPILMMLVAGIVYFGLAYNAKIELSSAVREGARKLALGGTVTDAESAVQSAAPSLTSVSFPSVPTVCVSGVTSNSSITASYAMTYTIPFFGSGTWTLKATGVMKCEV